MDRRADPTRQGPPGRRHLYLDLPLHPDLTPHPRGQCIPDVENEVPPLGFHRASCPDSGRWVGPDLLPGQPGPPGGGPRGKLACGHDRQPCERHPEGIGECLDRHRILPGDWVRLALGQPPGHRTGEHRPRPVPGGAGRLGLLPRRRQRDRGRLFKPLHSGELYQSFRGISGILPNGPPRRFRVPVCHRFHLR